MRAMAVFLGLVGCGYLIQLQLPVAPVRRSHQNLPPRNSNTSTMISTIKPMPPKPPPP